MLTKEHHHKLKKKERVMLLWVVIREEMHYPGMTTDQLAGIKQFISGRERIIHSEQLLGFALQRIQV